MLNSKKLLALAFCLSTVIYVNASKASEHILASISTNVQKDSYHLIVDINEEDQTLKTFYIDNFSNNQFVNRDELSIKTFIKEGIKLPHNGKITFVKITGENFDQEKGGIIVLDTLYNIITAKRKSYELQLAQDKSGWKLFYKGNAISKILAIVNKLPIIGIVGARDLSMN